MMRRPFWANVTGLLLVGGGAAVMTGWLTHVPLWELAGSAGTVMVFQSALCFVLSGISLLAPQFVPTYSRHIRIAAGIAILVIAGLMMAQSMFSIDLGIDLADLHRWYSDHNPHPGRMAPNSSVGFLLCGAALLLSVTGNRAGVLYDAIPASISTLGLIGLAGYTLLFDLAYAWYDVPRMAVTTSTGLLLVGIGLTLDHAATPTWTLRYKGGSIENAVDSRVYAFLGVAVTILSMVIFVSYGSIQELMRRAAWVEHSGKVRTEFETLIALDNRAYNAWQSFLVGGDSDSLDTLRGIDAELQKRLARLDRMTADNDAQQARLEALRQYLEEDIPALFRIAELTAADRNQRRQVYLERLPQLKKHRLQFDAIAEDFRNEETRLQTERQLKSQKSADMTIMVILIGNGLGFIIMFYAAWLLKRQNDVRDTLTTALQRSYTFLDSLVENIPSMVFVKDAENLRFIRFNKAAEVLFGIPRGEVLGKTDYDLIPKAEADITSAIDRAVLAGGKLVDQPAQLVHTRDKGQRILHTQKIPISDRQGVLQYVLGIAEDITERKRAEEEIVGLNSSLKAYTAQLEASNKELESFTYSVSHDLRAPLRAINGYALMLEEDYRERLDESATRYIAQIRNYSNQMGTLIDDLLHLSRLGRQDLRMVELDMNGMVNDALQVERCAGQNAYDACQIDVADLPPAKADPLLLRQVWTNLVSNALKYSSKNPHPQIFISGRREGGEVIYSIRDNGVGFDMAYNDKLFNVFQRLHRVDEFPGTGVGLAIVHRVVTRHGGRVWATATVGQGAEFFFTLPAA